jgi:blocked-early-in-transport protein 1
MSNPMRNRSGNNNNNNNSSNNHKEMHGRRGGYDLEGGGRGGRGGGYNDTNSNILEQQNNERINELSDQVARLKGLTIDIGNEVREQNSLLDNMGDGFQNTADLLRSSLGRIGTMLESGGTKHMCYMILFCVAAVCFLWWLMKFTAK